MRVNRNIRSNQKLRSLLSAAVFIIVLSTMVLTTGGCKQAAFNITGNWLINFTLDESGVVLVAFSGSKTVGSVIWENQMSGEYNVSDKQVDFVLRIYVSTTNTSSSELYVFNFTGSFDDEDHLSGTCTAYKYSTPDEIVSGTWDGQRR